MNKLTNLPLFQSKSKASLQISPVPALLALEDGRIFTGRAIGAIGTTVGELVFNTSMTGYQEILTDPSYAGQIITFTYPEIGNYGSNEEDAESSRVYARGIVIRHLSTVFSSWRANQSLEDFLIKHNVVGITDVDTRAITRHIRDKGALRCALSSEQASPDKLLSLALDTVSMNGADFTEEVTIKTPYAVGDGRQKTFKVAVLDFGLKANILEQLEQHKLSLKVYPASTKANDILKDKPDAIFLSNGPGDPAACKEIIEEVKLLIASQKPIFGICLGHQLLALALGAQTYKLKFGHRGANQPVMDLTSGKVEITCQNHGFAVNADTIPDTMMLTHINLNDNSVEGFSHKSLPIFAVQYHPESSPGPHDSRYLFQRFYKLIQDNVSK